MLGLRSASNVKLLVIIIHVYPFWMQQGRGHSKRHSYVSVLGFFVRLVEERFGPNMSPGESCFNSLYSSGAHADHLHRNVFLAVELAMLFKMDFLSYLVSEYGQEQERETSL